MADQTDRTYKLHVKLGESVFEAEGPEETVKAQFKDFLAIVQEQPKAPRKPAAGGGAGEGSGAGDDASIPREHLDRVFKVDEEGIVSLLHQPKTQNMAADALVMLLWGFRTLKGREQVSALDLMKAARPSGLNIDRIDRVIYANEQYVTKGGAKRGTKYSLNNPGVVYGKRLVAELFN